MVLILKIKASGCEGKPKKFFAWCNEGDWSQSKARFKGMFKNIYAEVSFM